MPFALCSCHMSALSDEDFVDAEDGSRSHISCDHIFVDDIIFTPLPSPPDTGHMIGWGGGGDVPD